MKRCLTAFLALILLTSGSLCAQNLSSVALAMSELEKRYEETPGVECMNFTKGSGLELMKMALKREFGKSFIKGVNIIIIVEYSEASEQTCQSIHNDLEVFTSMLEEFSFDENEEFAENDYIRCFAAKTATNTLSDFIIALEGEGSKMLMYMGGVIVVE